MAAKIGRLPSTPSKLNQYLKKPGKHEDGGGLRLVVDKNGNARWVMRVSILGARREFGLGAYPHQRTLAQARQRADAIRRAAAAGRDLVAEERQQEAEEAAAAIQAENGPVTFQKAFEEFWLDKAPTLRNDKHRNNWRYSIEHHCRAICDRPVAEITGTEVHAVLKPLWQAKPQAAEDVLQRMRATFESAIFHSHRTAACPCTGIERILGSKPRNVRRHPALPYADVPRFLKQLYGLNRAGSGTKLALYFLILTAMRSEAVRQARWPEIDQETAIWTVPAEHMKGRGTQRSEHRVPLCGEALGVLKKARQELQHNDGLIFPSKLGRTLSDNTLSKVIRSDMGLQGGASPHGFRSTFKDWCAEVAKVPDEVSEAALGHKDQNRVRAAYLRTDFLDQRRSLMDAWGQHCRLEP
ncbi:MAG: integrase arm-type DNA-binding domain-containing protein [Pseudomonadota bacterium]